MLVPQHSHGGAVVKPQSSRFGGFIHSDSFLYVNLRSTQNFGEQIKAMGADLDALGDLRKDLLEIRTGLEAEVSGVACCTRRSVYDSHYHFFYSFVSRKFRF